MSNFFSTSAIKRNFISSAGFLVLLGSVLGSSSLLADSAVTARAGTLGLGLEYELGLTDNYSIRVGYNKYTFDETIADTSVTYNADLNLNSVTAFFDYHILETGLRLTAGLASNSNSLDLVGVANAGDFVFNGTTYSTAEVAALNGSISYDSTAPYAGIGWGNPTNSSGTWALNFDLGVLFSGNPLVDLSVTCDPSVPAATCTEIETNVFAEAQTLANTFDDLKLYPVVMLGLSYKL